MEEAAHTDTVQTRLRLLRPVFVQLHTIGIAVVSLGDLPQSLAAAAAGIEHIGGDSLREPDPPQDMADIVRIRWIVAHADIVHEAADHRGVYRIRPLRQLLRKAVQHLINGLVGPGHEVESGKSGLQFTGRSSQCVFLQFQKSQPRLTQIVLQAHRSLFQFFIAGAGFSRLALEILLHSGTAGQKLGAAP